MKTISEKDFIIIKNSSNWATRSISKMRLMFDRAFGEELKSILNKSVGLNGQMKDVLDSFVSGSVLKGTKNSKTLNDHEAISSFVIVGNNFNNISNQITSVILPSLRKTGVEISPEDFEEKKPDKGDKGDKDKKSTKESALNELQTIMEDLHNVALTDFAPEKAEQIIQDRNKVMRFLESNIELINKSESDDEIKKLYADSINTYNLFLSTYKDEMQSLASGVFAEIIKTASSVEETVSYYLLSLGGYTKVITPMKEKLLAIKNFLGYGGDETIYYLRLDCLNYTKLLIKKSSWLIDEVEDAIKIKDQKAKWIKVINAFNEFGEEYNRYRKAYIEMFSIMKIKVNQDKLKRKRKDERKVSEPALSDFIEHSWVEMPARVDMRFPKATLVMK